MKIAYKTNLGVFYSGKIEEALSSKRFEKYKGKIDLIFTSPPFPAPAAAGAPNRSGIWL